VACRDRRASARLQRAVGLLSDQAAAGALCEDARWILESRLVFLRKKRGPAPRPIRIGELWRRVVAKRLLHTHRDAVQAACRAARQFGVGEPGGADALVHWRVLLEELLAGGAGHGAEPGDALAVIDVDLANAFPSFEWGYVRQAVQEQLPALLPWTAWVHRAATPVQLPCGTTLETDRGAEQGDPLGPLYCALALARVLQRVRARGVAFCDAWYMDDGQIVCRARHVPLFLEELDAELFDAGAARGRGAAAKSVVAVPAPAPLAAAARPHWATDYVLHSVVQAPGPRHVLGIDFGGGGAAAAAPSAQLTGATARVSDVHAAIAALDDVPAELVLLRRCADVCKVVHLLRASGPALDASALAAYDAMVDRSLGRLLGGPLDDAAVAQARLGVRVGGLGLRSAADLALPAFYASRTEAQPHVARLAAALVECGFEGIPLLPRFEEQRDAALTAWLASLPPALATEAQAAIDAWAARDDVGAHPAAALPGESLLLPAGGEDPEHAEDGRLQHLLCGFADRARAAAQRAAHEAADRAADAVRMRELADPGVSHDWLWALNPVHGPCLRADEFLLALRARLGAPLADPADGERPCACCSRPLDAAGTHALACARAEATRGHYAVRDCVLHLAHLADPTAECEVPGLVASAPMLRPADVLTAAAFPGRLAALDVGVTSPHRPAAGDDACAAMHASKLAVYAPYSAELAASGVAYLPLVWSAYGRPHPEASAALELLARRAARRRGLRCHRPLLRRTLAAVGVALWRRLAAMQAACLPPLGPEESQLLFGGDLA
jgi:hypothetical protein